MCVSLCVCVFIYLFIYFKGQLTVPRQWLNYCPRENDLDLLQRNVSFGIMFYDSGQTTLLLNQ